MSGPSGSDDMPFLMSAPNADAPRLARVELSEDTITLELHHPAYEVGILTLGFSGRPRIYNLVETGYTLDAAPWGEMFCFVAEEHASGKRYRWYVHTENPTETFVRINAHIEAKAPPKHGADPSPQLSEAREIATAPSPTDPSPTRPLRIENEHEPADKDDLETM